MDTHMLCTSVAASVHDIHQPNFKLQNWGRNYLTACTNFQGQITDTFHRALCHFYTFCHRLITNKTKDENCTPRSTRIFHAVKFP